MFKPEKLDELAAKFSDMVQNSPAKDIERNARALLAQGMSKLDLVSREEFEIQRELLQRAQQQLKQLEHKVMALEAKQTPTTPEVRSDSGVGSVQDTAE